MVVAAKYQYVVVTVVVVVVLIVVTAICLYYEFWRDENEEFVNIADLLPPGTKGYAKCVPEILEGKSNDSKTHCPSIFYNWQSPSARTISGVDRSNRDYDSWIDDFRIVDADLRFKDPSSNKNPFLRINKATLGVYEAASVNFQGRQDGRPYAMFDTATGSSVGEKRRAAGFVVGTDTRLPTFGSYDKNKVQLLSKNHVYIRNKDRPLRNYRFSMELVDKTGGNQSVPKICVKPPDSRPQVCLTKEDVMHLKSTLLKSNWDPSSLPNIKNTTATMTFRSAEAGNEIRADNMISRDLHAPKHGVSNGANANLGVRASGRDNLQIGAFAGPGLLLDGGDKYKTTMQRNAVDLDGKQITAQQAGLFTNGWAGSSLLNTPSVMRQEGEPYYLDVSTRSNLKFDYPFSDPPWNDRYKTRLYFTAESTPRTLDMTKESDIPQTAIVYYTDGALDRVEWWEVHPMHKPFGFAVNVNGIFTGNKGALSPLFLKKGDYVVSVQQWSKNPRGYLGNGIRLITHMNNKYDLKGKWARGQPQGTIYKVAKGERVSGLIFTGAKLTGVTGTNRKT